jgi:hypothetical protein
MKVQEGGPKVDMYFQDFDNMKSSRLAQIQIKKFHM